MDKQVLSIYYQNCRGLNTKLNNIYMSILQHNYDIIVLTETWLQERIADSCFIDTRYRVFRCDRQLDRCDKRDGAGCWSQCGGSCL